MTTRTPLTLGCLAFVLLAAAGCHPDVPIGGDDAGRRADGGGGGVRCGSATCGPEQYCCNESCGVCAPIGGACDTLFCGDHDAGPPPGDGATRCIVTGCSGQICADTAIDTTCEWLPEYECYRTATCATQSDGACGWTHTPDLDACLARYRSDGGTDGGTHDGGGSCAAQDATGVGPCDAFFGYYWNGATCVLVGGCTCSGADCGHGWPTPEECVTAHAGCAGDRCGGFGGSACGAGEFCDYDDYSCAFPDESGHCTTRPTVCPDVYSPVCGCDGADYGNECEAHGAGTNVAHDGTCTTTADCRTAGCPPTDYCSLCWGRWACIPVGAVC